MKTMLYKNLTKVLINPKQKEIFTWLVQHHSVISTAFETWEMLFDERLAKQPDVCIAMYDSLSLDEKIILEHAFSRYVYDNNF